MKIWYLRVKTVKSWNFSCCCWEVDTEDTNEVVKVYCKICRDYYKDSASNTVKNYGVVKMVLDRYVEGTKVIKKNFEDHVKKSETHRIAAQRLSEQKTTSAIDRPSK